MSGSDLCDLCAVGLLFECNGRFHLIDSIEWFPVHVFHKDIQAIGIFTDVVVPHHEGAVYLKARLKLLAKRQAVLLLCGQLRFEPLQDYPLAVPTGAKTIGRAATTYII